MIDSSIYGQPYEMTCFQLSDMNKLFWKEYKFGTSDIQKTTCFKRHIYRKTSRLQTSYNQSFWGLRALKHLEWTLYANNLDSEASKFERRSARTINHVYASKYKRRFSSNKRKKSFVPNEPNTTKAKSIMLMFSGSKHTHPQGRWVILKPPGSTRHASSKKTNDVGTLTLKE